MIGSTQFGKFFLKFMLHLLSRDYCIEFIVFWKRVGGVGNASKTTAWLSRFYVVTSVSDHDRAFLVLCRDMVLKL